MNCSHQKWASVSCAMTALAAQLIPDGDTCHKIFGIPVRARRDGTEPSYIEACTRDGDRLVDARLIVIDEVSMMSGWQAVLIDNLLQVINCVRFVYWVILCRARKRDSHRSG